MKQVQNPIQPIEVRSNYDTDTKALRYPVLDGWRAIAILLVLSAHLLPLGRHAWGLNESVGLAGMALFFCLSGFLVTDVLIERPDVLSFLIRRLFRILPLAWLYLLIVFSLQPMSFKDGLAHTFFYANYPPKPLIFTTDHLWSLCVELHFYIGLSLIFYFFKKYWTILVPIICFLITFIRIKNNVHYSVITHLRVDEIIAGALLAMINRDILINKKTSNKVKKFLGGFPFLVAFIFFIISCYINSGFFNYYRPYFAASLVGVTLFSAQGRIYRLLSNKFLNYVASISFALYIIHPLLVHSWFGTGDILEKYAKRPLLFLALIVLAHSSTFYYEKSAIKIGKRLIRALSQNSSKSTNGQIL